MDFDDRVPITACLSPAQAERLEVLIAHYRDRTPGTDDNQVVDFVFALGLDTAEMALDLEKPDDDEQG